MISFFNINSVIDKYVYKDELQVEVVMEVQVPKDIEDHGPQRMRLLLFQNFI